MRKVQVRSITFIEYPRTEAVTVALGISKAMANRRAEDVPFYQGRLSGFFVRGYGFSGSAGAI